MFWSCAQHSVGWERVTAALRLDSAKIIRSHDCQGAPSSGRNSTYITAPHSTAETAHDKKTITSANARAARPVELARRVQGDVDDRRVASRRRTAPCVASLMQFVVAYYDARHLLRKCGDDVTREASRSRHCALSLRGQVREARALSFFSD